MECGAGEHVVNPTGSAPSPLLPGQHGARQGLGLLGCASGCWGVAWARGEGKGKNGASWGNGELFPSCFGKRGVEHARGMGIGQKGGGEGDRVVCVWTAWLGQ